MNSSVLKKVGRPAFAERPYKTGVWGRHVLPAYYAIWPSLVAASLVAVRTSRLLLSPARVKFANDAEPVEGLENSQDGMPAFKLTHEGGLMLPYGEFTHRKGRQIFNREGAARMAANFIHPPEWVRKLFKWVSGESLGVPIYIGHPDVPELRAKYPDTKAYGWVEAIEPQAAGALLRIKWSEEGRKLAANAHYRFHSPYWFGIQQPDGTWLIDFLRSVGLTNEPNMPVPALANEAPPTEPPPNEKDTMNPEIIKKLKALLGLEESADEVAFENAVTSLDKKAKDSAAEVDRLKQEKDALEAERKPPADKGDEKARADMENTMAEAKSTLAALRKDRVTLAVDASINSGRMAPAQREVEVTRIMGLANAATDFDAALSALAKLPVKYKVTSLTEDAAGARKLIDHEKAHQAEERRQAMANAVQDELVVVRRTVRDSARAYQIAFNNAQRKHPHLFTASEAQS